MIKQQYSREDLIALFRPQNLENLSNSKYIISLKAIPGSLIKKSVQFPTNFYTDQLHIKGFNQEILVFSSNTPTPLKTVNVKSKDQFRFDDQVFTPKPQQNDTFFVYHTENSPSPQKTMRNKPIFSHSRQMRYGSLYEKVWFYIDDSNNVQGPFSSIEMDTWYSKGYFTYRTEIAFRMKRADSFLKLKYLRYCKYLRGEKMIYQKIIGRRKSAPQNLSLAAQIDQQGPATKGKSKFGFSEQDQFFPEIPSQIQDLHDDNYHELFQKVLSIPSGKLGKNKGLKN